MGGGLALGLASLTKVGSPLAPAKELNVPMLRIPQFQRREMLLLMVTHATLVHFRVSKLMLIVPSAGGA